MNADQAVALFQSGKVPTELIFVQQVLNREFKDDCRGGTKTVWNGLGDIQLYPASLWQKLAPHPDVWAVFDPVPATVDDATRERLATEAAQADQKRASEELKLRESEAKGAGTDLVMATAVPTFEEVHAMEYPDLQALQQSLNLGLHPRQKRETVIDRVVEHLGLKPAAAKEAGSDEAGTDDASGDAAQE